MKKEEKIKEAWALCSIPKKIEQLTECYWFRCERSQVEHLKDEFDFITWSLKECSIRPKSLQGIENNNGWIRIESEADLPKIGEYDMSSFTLYYWTNNGLYQSEDYKRWKLHYDHLQITHYRLEPIFKPKPPIY